MEIRKFILKLKRRQVKYYIFDFWEKYLLYFYVVLDDTFVSNNVDF